MLETRVAFLAGLLLPAVLIEAGNGEPGPICRGLAGLLVEAGGKGILASKLSRVDLQIIVANAALIHPFAHTLIADELGGADGFVYRGVLALVDPQLVVEYQHADPVYGRLPEWQSPAWLREQCSEPRPL
jgi:hypothetical protein